MKNRIILLVVLCIAFSPIRVLSQTIEAKTAFIGNNEFILSEPWMNLPVDNVKGEDINSAHYGKVFTQVLKARYPEFINKVTIAKNEMDIDLLIENNSASQWRVLSITLQPIEQLKLPAGEITKGEWPYSTRGDKDDIQFIISQNLLNPVQVVPNEILITPKGQSDNKLNINVKSEKRQISDRMVMSFSITIEVQEVGTMNAPQLLKPKKVFLLYVD